MKNNLLALVLVSGLMGTGASAAPSEALFVITGGRTSCAGKAPKPYNVGLWSKYTELSRKIKAAHPDLKISYLVSCLHGEAPPTATMEFITSEEPKRVRRGNAKVFLNEIERMEGGMTAPVTFLIGHSYGGWLAMYLTEKLRLNNGIALLASVDPISNECGPSGVIFGAEVCKQAPKNLPDADIKDAVGTWLNFYQTQDSWINSGPVKLATKNFHIKYRGPHNSIDVDPRTWKEIEGVVMAGLAPAN